MHLYSKMKKRLAISIVVGMTLGAVPTIAQTNDYSDHWAEKPITEWSKKGIVVGYEDGTFKPENTITRAELAQILSRVFGLVERNEAITFKDVEEDAWYTAGIQKIMTADIMNSYADGTFRPDQAVTREEAAYAIARAYHMLESTDDLGFTDKGNIAEWAKGSIATLVTEGVLSGYPDGSFKPEGSLKRSEVVSMLDRITAELFVQTGQYSKDIEGNVVINTADVALENMMITGNLYIGAGVQDGDVALTNVTVLGDVIVSGGGSNTISLFGKSTVGDIVVNKKGGEMPCIYVAPAAAIKQEAVLETSAILQFANNTLPKVTLEGAEEVVVKGKGKIPEIVIKKTAVLTLGEDITAETLRVTKEATHSVFQGEGELTKELLIEADDFDYSGATIGKDTIVTETEEVQGTITPSQATGGGGGGGSSSGSVTQYPSIIIEGIVLNPGTANELSIPLDGALDIVIDMSTEKITVEGIDLSEQAVSTVAFNTATNTEKVIFGVASLGEFDVTLEAGKTYDKAELIACFVEGAYEEKAIALIEANAHKVGLTPAQVDKVKALVHEGVKAGMHTPIPLTTAHIIEKIERGEPKIKDYIHYLEQVDANIDAFGLRHIIGRFEVGFGDEEKTTVASIKASGTGTVDGIGRYTPKNYTVNLTYTGNHNK